MDQGATAARRAHDRAGKAARRPIEDDRVRVDASRNTRTIRYDRTLDPRSGLGDRRVARCLCASLLAGRSTMAGVDGHRTADGVADPQFRFLAESQLLADRPSSPHLVP